MNYKIVTSRHAADLVLKVNELMAQGWKREGSHQVVTQLVQNQYSGMQHQRSLYENEYSQTMVKE